MQAEVNLIALFNDITPIPDVLDQLRSHGVAETDMSLLTNLPYPAQVLGRPMVWERLPLISLSGAFVGFLIGIFLNAGTPLLYPIHVGGQPLIPIPPTLVLTYELTMMGLIVSTFLGVLWESTFPSHGPRRYDPRVSDGQIGIVFQCSQQEEAGIRSMLEELGVDQIIEPEEITL